MSSLDALTWHLWPILEKESGIEWKRLSVKKMLDKALEESNLDLVIRDWLEEETRRLYFSEEKEDPCPPTTGKKTT